MKKSIKKIKYEKVPVYLYFDKTSSFNDPGVLLSENKRVV